MFSLRARPEPVMPIQLAPAEAIVMTDAEIDSATNVLGRKHQRGELTDLEHAMLADALRRERGRRITESGPGGRRAGG